VLNLPFRPELTGAEIQTRGEVRYCRPGVGLGVEFVGIADSAVRAILAEIESPAAPNLQAPGQRGNANPFTAGPESKNRFRNGKLLTFFNVGNRSFDEHSHALHFFLYCCA
jgi:hypothetical protein